MDHLPVDKIVVGRLRCRLLGLEAVQRHAHELGHIVRPGGPLGFRLPASVQRLPLGQLVALRLVGDVLERAFESGQAEERGPGRRVKASVEDEPE